MQIEDRWHRHGQRSERYGQGLRWRARWREDGKHRAKSFRTKQAAEKWLTLHLSRPVVEGPEIPTVGVLVQRWRDAKNHLAPKTREAAKTASRHVTPRWGHLSADQVMPSEVRVWLAGLELSESTKRHIFLCLKGALELAVEDGILPRNPVAGIKAPVSGKREPTYMTIEDLKALAAAAGKWEAMVLLMGTTGIRIGEACGLDVADVGAKRIRVRPEVSKSDRGRDVPVPASVRAMLDLDREGPLFRSPAGKRVDPGNWRVRVFAEAAKAVGREGLDPHELRHTAASLAIAAGADVMVVQRMLGHKSAAVTLGVYAHLWDGNLDDVAARMDAALGA